MRFWPFGKVPHVAQRFTAHIGEPTEAFRIECSCGEWAYDSPDACTVERYFGQHLADCHIPPEPRCEDAIDTEYAMVFSTERMRKEGRI